MDVWTMDSDGTDITVAADRDATVVVLTVAAELGEVVEGGKVSVRASLSTTKAEHLRAILGTAIGIAQGAPS